MASVQPSNGGDKKTIEGTGTYKDGLVAPKKDTRYKTEDVSLIYQSVNAIVFVPAVFLFYRGTKGS